MAAPNTNPIYTRVGRIGGFSSADGNGGTAGPLKTANTARDGTGTVLTVFTADATNGSFIKSIRFRSAGNCTTTVARIFVNNGGVNSTLGNNILIDEITLSGTTATNIAAVSPYELRLDMAIDPGFKINVTLGTTVTDGYFVSVITGDY